MEIGIRQHELVRLTRRKSVQGKVLNQLAPNHTSAHHEQLCIP